MTYYGLGNDNSVNSLISFIAGIAVLQFVPWFFGVLAGTAFSTVVGYLDSDSEFGLLGAMAVFACAWISLSTLISNLPAKRSH